MENMDINGPYLAKPTCIPTHIHHAYVSVGVFCTSKNKVVKIVHSSFEMVL
jgi:hypothetical protein